MRKFVWVALLVLLAVGLFLFLNDGMVAGGDGPPMPAENSLPAPLSFGMYSAELADSGNGTAAVMRLFLFGAQKGGEVQVFCSGRPMQRTALVLEHPRAPGAGGMLGKEIERQLAACGLSSLNASVAEALESDGAVLIAPTGAVPMALLENQANLSRQNDRVIVAMSLPGKAINEIGDISPLDGSGLFELVRMSDRSDADAAKEIAKRAVLPSGSNARWMGWQEGNFSAVVFSNQSRLYCRAVYLSQGACRFSDSGLLSRPPGTLAGSTSAKAGEKIAFEFSPAEGNEVGRDLRFYAALSEGGKEILRQEIAGGQIRPGWASRFFVNASGGGRYLLRVMDQFGRLHASAYFEAHTLEVKLVFQEGNRYEFLATVAGENVSGAITAWIDGGERKQFYSSNGKLTIFASPSPGKRVMHFEYDGMESQHAFVSQGGGFVESYARLLAPALVFLFAVYFLFRVRRQVKYSITFPEFAPRETMLLKASEREILDAWRSADRKIGSHNLPCTPEEIGMELLAKTGSEERSLNYESMLGTLRSLVELGKFEECDGSFIPAKETGGFSAKELAVLRFLHDLMLERGVRFGRKKVHELPKRNLEIAVFGGRGDVLHGIRKGKNRRAVVFSDRDELQNFEKSLRAHEEENIRIKIALSLGKVFFVTASRADVEPLLP